MSGKEGMERAGSAVERVRALPGRAGELILRMAQSRVEEVVRVLGTGRSRDDYMMEVYLLGVNDGKEMQRQGLRRRSINPGGAS